MGIDEASKARPEAARVRFDVAFDAHYRHVLSFALRRVPSRTDADDVAAETFAVAWRRRDSIPEPSLPWLYGVAARVIDNQRRSARRLSRLRGRLGGEPMIVGADPGDAIGARDELAVAFAQLSGAHREVLRLAAWEGLDAPDAALVLGCTPAAYRARLHRARRDLAKHMGVSGHEPSEGKNAQRERTSGETG